MCKVLALIASRDKNFSDSSQTDHYLVEAILDISNNDSDFT